MEAFLDKLELLFAKIHANFWIEVTVFLTAAGLFWKQIKVMICGLFKILYMLLIKPKQIIDFFTSIQRGMLTLQEIGKEFKNNGGSSFKDAIDALRRENIFARYRSLAIINHRKIAYYETNLKGECTFVSKEWSKLTGISLNDALGHGWRNGLAEYDLKRVSEAFTKAVEDKREFEMIYDLVDREGNITKVIGHAAVAKDRETDTVIGFIGTAEPLERT